MFVCVFEEDFGHATARALAHAHNLVMNVTMEFLEVDNVSFVVLRNMAQLVQARAHVQLLEIAITD